MLRSAAVVNKQTRKRSPRQDVAEEEVHNPPMLAVEELAKMKKQVQDLLEEKMERTKQEQERKAKKLAKKEKEERVRQCSICLDVLDCPLRMCENDHLACVSCILNQAHAESDISLRCKQYYDKDNMPVSLICDFDFSTLKCPECRSAMLLSFPGTNLMLFLDPKCGTKCLFCNEKFPLSKIGLHYLSCQSQFTQCCWCEEEFLPLDRMKYHVEDDCKKLKCKLCHEECSYKELLSHMKTHNILSRTAPLLQRMLQEIILKQKEDSAANPSEFFRFAGVFLSLANALSFAAADGVAEDGVAAMIKDIHRNFTARCERYMSLSSHEEAVLFLTLQKEILSVIEVMEIRFDVGNGRQQLRLGSPMPPIISRLSGRPQPPPLPRPPARPQLPQDHFTSGGSRSRSRSRERRARSPPNFSRLLFAAPLVPTYSPVAPSYSPSPSAPIPPLQLPRSIARAPVQAIPFDLEE